jgi:predicted ATPase
LGTGGGEIIPDHHGFMAGEAHGWRLQGANMEKLMEIKSVKVQNFGCIKDLEMKLTPLHAVIGPNDSGKSTLLRAVRTASQLYDGRFNVLLNNHHEKTGIIPFDPGSADDANISLKLVVNDKCNFNYMLSILRENAIIEHLTDINGESIHVKRSLFDLTTLRAQMPPNSGQTDFFGLYYSKICPDIKLALPRMVRLDPDSLRLPGGLIASSDPIEFHENGRGLASVLDSLMKRHLSDYLLIRQKLIDIFPTVADINLENINDREIKLGIKLKNGAVIASEFISEGMLYYLAYSALQCLKPASILLIEEPENGLHPSRIKEVMSIIRELSKTTQVLIATHSPLVINEMEPDEVTVLWRDEEKGTQATPIKDTKNFEDRSQVYALGELWLSYADGKNELELRTGKE